MSSTGTIPGPRYIALLIFLAGAVALFSRAAQGLPPPLSPEELERRADLVAEGRVIRVWPYERWRADLKSGGLPGPGPELLQQLPPTAAALLPRLHNFPYRTSKDVVVDGVDIAAIRIDRVLKGPPTGTVFIPFVRYHFPAGRGLIGPWSERAYRVGEHLKLYLRQSGPFYESVWWNAVENLTK